MKIEITKKLRFSPDGRRTLPLDKGAVIGVGENGLTKENFARLVELEVARVLEVDDIPVAEAAEVEPEADNDNDDDAPDAESVPIDFGTITNKDQLEAFARENHDVELDKRKSLKNMKVDLEEKIATKPDVTESEEETDHA